MHFHLAKPLHGWRAFVGEVGTAGQRSVNLTFERCGADTIFAE